MRLAPTRGPARIARGVVAGAMCTLLSVSGHVAAGGGLPDTGLLAVLALLLTGFLIALADRRRGPGTILALVAGSQLGLHWLLEMLGSHAHLARTGGAVGSALVVDPVLMTLVHAGATLLAAAVLGGAEHGVFTLAAALSRALYRLLPRPSARPVTRCSDGPVRPAVAVRSTWLRGVLGGRVPARRGPPPVPAGSCP